MSLNIRRIAASLLLPALITWTLSPFTTLAAQPVAVPALNAPAFQAPDFDPYFNQAQSLQSEAAWAASIGAGRFVLTANWESAVDSQIQSHLLAVSQSDTYNTTADYQDYLRKELEIQKQAALTSWEIEADRIIEQRRVFGAAW